jgi:hypothetical protein
MYILQLAVYKYLMKRYRQFILENQEEHDYHHATHADSFDTKSDKPLWLSHSEHQAKGWHNTDNSEKTSSYKIKLKPGTKIAHHADPKVRDHLAKNGVHINNYVGDLTSNPDHKEINSHPGTQALKNAGYHGFTHPDYDPHNNQKDHDTTLLFSASHVQSAKKVTHF